MNNTKTCSIARNHDPDANLNSKMIAVVIQNKNTRIFGREGLSIKNGLKDKAKGRDKNQKILSNISPSATKDTLGLASNELRRR